MASRRPSKAIIMCGHRIPRNQLCEQCVMQDRLRRLTDNTYFKSSSHGALHELLCIAYQLGYVEGLEQGAIRQRAETRLAESDRKFRASRRKVFVEPGREHMNDPACVHGMPVEARCSDCEAVAKHG